MVGSVRLLVAGVLMLSLLGASACASEGSYEQAQTQLAQAKQEKEELAAQLASAKSELAQEEARVTGLTSEMANLKSKLGQEEANTSKLNALISRLKEELAAEKDEADRLSTELSQAEAATTELEQELERAKAEVANLKKGAAPPATAATPAPGAATGGTFATYEDKPKAFSIGYPQGWTVLTGKDLPTLAAEGLEMIAFLRSYEGPLLKVMRYATSDVGYAEMTLQEMVDYVRVGIPMVYPSFNELSSGQMLTAQGLECYYFLYSRQDGTDHYTDKLLLYVDDNTIIYEVTVSTLSTKFNDYGSLFTRIFDTFSVTNR